MAHIDCSFYSASLLKNVHVIVFLPSVSADDYLEDREIHYFDPQTRFPTLYLLHGSYGDCMDWCLRTGIERYAQDKGIAVVMPSGENSSYINMAHGERYLDYIGKELPEFMTRMFPLSKDREKTYIAGLSMGGYGAWRVGLGYPGTFGAIASLSGALDMAALMTSGAPHVSKMPEAYRRAVFADTGAIPGPENDLPALLRRLLEAGTPLPRMYMTCGTEDFIFPTNESFFRAAGAMGIDITYEKYPGVHDWDFWDSHIRDVLRWLPD
ncbi:MAG: esterase family protein [Clostridia bacterium]|nr:esterase family protein [Clostridia bacterium]